MIKRLYHLVDRSVRYKLLLLALTPLLLVLPAVLIFAIYWSHQFSYDQLYRKVNTDLAVARAAFARAQQDHLATLKSLVDSYSFRTGLQARDAVKLQNHLTALKSTSDFDFLHLVDARGRRLFTADLAPGVSKPSAQLAGAFQTGRPTVGVEVYTQAELQNESPVLANRAAIALQALPGESKPPRDVEDRGLVLRAIYPVTDEQGRILAAVEGGVLLNRNFRFVDGLRDLVYGPGSVPRGGWGAVTVLLDDVRITTNVPQENNQNERALGTRAAEDVRQVLRRPDPFIDRTFVVHDWYISGYAPIHDVDGERVATLVAGFVEAPFRVEFEKAVALLLAALLLSAVIGIAIGFKGARAIFQPLETMMAVVRAGQAGQQRRIGPVRSKDEIGALAREFDTLLDRLERRQRQVREFAESLEVKVEERTHELKRRNIDLQRTIDLLHETRQHLVMSAKLAALGELTAGIAHEINNPVAVMLGNLDLLVSELGEHAEPVRTEVELIVEQIYRIRAIVDKLLQYSRPAEYVGYLEDVDVNQVVDDTLVLVRHELERKDVRIAVSAAARTRIRINPQDLQQVLVNLLLNAVHAVPERGRIRVRTEDWPGQGVIVRVKDNGVGIPPERLSRIFEPFFTTRAKGGTGLGLSVSYGLIRRHGGDIQVDSREGEWTQFDIFLRRRPPSESEAELAAVPLELEPPDEKRA